MKFLLDSRKCNSQLLLLIEAPFTDPYSRGLQFCSLLVLPFCLLIDLMRRLVVADLMKRGLTIKERRRMSGMDYCRM